MGDSEKLKTLRLQASVCRRCDLFARGTQTVFGEGRVHAPIFIVGEQPGDKEDLSPASSCVSAPRPAAPCLDGP